MGQYDQEGQPHEYEMHSRPPFDTAKICQKMTVTVTQQKQQLEEE
jgi:hypothetical protein